MKFWHRTTNPKDIIELLNAIDHKDALPELQEQEIRYGPLNPQTTAVFPMNATIADTRPPSESHSFVGKITMQQQTCAGCKHWTKSTVEEHGSCNSPAFIYTGGAESTPLNGLGYWDRESYRAGFNTGPDFGCLHWEAKV